ncbi:hypothetical protein [Streptomyces olivaceoviridis]
MGKDYLKRVLAALLAPTTAHAAPAATAPRDTVALPVQEALARLPVRTEERTGHERTKFKHCVDADKEGCNPRAEVLRPRPSSPRSRARTAA